MIHFYHYYFFKLETNIIFRNHQLLKAHLAFQEAVILLISSLTVDLLTSLVQWWDTTCCQGRKGLFMEGRVEMLIVPKIWTHDAFKNSVM